jgi:hypothetical protein
MHRPTLVVLGLLLAAAPASAQTSEEVEKKVLDEVNAYRAKKDAPKLEADDKLNEIAQAHAKGMAKADKYGDDGKNGHVWQGKGPADRVKAAGYKHLGFAENVGWNVGQKDPGGSMIKTWLKSAPHEKNISTKDFTRAGVAAAKGKSGKWYYVLVMAKPQVVERTLKLTITNRTKEKIAFRVGTKKYEIGPDKMGELTHTTTATKVQIGVTWPGKAKEELFDVADKGSYALTESEGKYAFEKIESK